MLADVICYWKTTSFMALDGVTLQIHVNEPDVVKVLAEVIQCNGRKLEEAEDFKCVFVVYCVLDSK